MHVKKDQYVHYVPLPTFILFVIRKLRFYNLNIQLRHVDKDHVQSVCHVIKQFVNQSLGFNVLDTEKRK